MKAKIIHFIILFSFLILIQSKEEGKVDILSPDSKYLSSKYASLFQVPISNIKYLFSNGGERTNFELYKAFDNDWNTHWRSEGQQGNNYTNEKTGITYDNLKNFIIITFEKEIYFDKMVYKTDNCNSCEGIGYPTTLKIYSKLSSTPDPYSDADFKLIDTIISEATQDIVLFTFSQTVNCNQIKLEWEEMKTYYPRFEKFTTAKEIQFFIPENEFLNETILNIFSSDDYRFMTLNPEFNSKELIEKIMQNNEHLLNFNTELKNYLERAKLASSGALKFDSKREFTTNQSKAINVIKQRGNIQSYTRNTLKMAMAGTNRQSLGIFTLANETINIYVHSEKNDPLPKLRFSQYIGNTNFLGNEINLIKGKQSLKCNNFNVEGYSIKVIPGGPLYLSNPYTNEEQSQNVKIYIEGGKLFPKFVLDENQSEEQYKHFLEEYNKMYEMNKDKYFDITEIVGIRCMMTVPASLAYNIYKDKTKGPIENLKNWDEYIKNLYSFDGVQYDSSQPYYDIKNIYSNLHIRYSQPFGAAYAAGEHIGIFDEGWLNGAIYGKVFGWGFAHEIGHMMDIPERTVIENSNNMISKFEETFIRKEGSRGAFEQSIKCLTPNDISVYDRGCENKENCNGFFTNVQMNFLIWWYIESLFPGYWGKLDNMYRYNYTISNGMSRTERFILFSNIITGIDLGDYFNRWGFFLNGEGIFFPENASEIYKEKMNTYINEGKIEKNKSLKLWYLDYKEYMLILNNVESCYENKDKYDIEIKKVFYINKSRSIILLPEINCEGHLGFEIYEKDKLIGFTYDNYYVDENEYDDEYIQNYKIIAYDRKLNSSIESEYKTKEINNEVCINNLIKHNSIKDAIEASHENEINIYLLKNTYEGSIEINKKVNIYISDDINDKNITIYKIDSKSLFIIKENGELNIIGKDKKNRIILDGMNIPSKGNLINSLKGTFNGNYLIFQNLNNTEDKGGAISMSSGSLNLNNTLISNNYAGQGAGLYAQISSGGMMSHLNNVVFERNKAKKGASIKNSGEIHLSNCEINNGYANDYGGGLANDEGGIAYLNEVKINNNYANNMGGGLYIDGLTSLTSVTISGNKASLGGGIAYIGGNNRRILNFEKGTLLNNNIANAYGGGIYIKNGIVNLNNGEIYGNKLNIDGNLNKINSEMLYIENGVINIDSIKLEGSIYKSNLCKINLKSSLMKYSDESNIYIDFPNNGVNISLIEGYKYNISSEDLNKIKLLDSNSGSLEIGPENNNILFIPKLLKVIFNKSTLISQEINEEKNNFYYGQVITLSEELFPIKENEYIAKIYDNNGKEYTLGENIKLVSNIEIFYDISYKNEIIFDFGDYEIKNLVIPSDDLYLPAFRKDYSIEKEILYWKDFDNNETFGISNKISAKENKTLVSIYSTGDYYLIQIYAFKIKYESQLLKYQDTISLPELIIPEKNHFNGWYDLYSNKKYDKSLRNILIEKDYYLVAIIIGYVKYYIGDELIIEKIYDINSTFFILNNSNFDNKKIDYWKEKNSDEKYYIDREYSLKEDLELIAVLKEETQEKEGTNSALVISLSIIGALIILIGAFLGYRYFRRKNSKFY